MLDAKMVLWLSRPAETARSNPTGVILDDRRLAVLRLAARQRGGPAASFSRAGLVALGGRLGETRATLIRTDDDQAVLIVLGPCSGSRHDTFATLSKRELQVAALVSRGPHEPPDCPGALDIGGHCEGSRASHSAEDGPGQPGRGRMVIVAVPDAVESIKWAQRPRQSGKAGIEGVDIGACADQLPAGKPRKKG